MSKLVLENINKVYYGHVALAGINLSLDSEKLNVILGGNGSGKTSLLRILAGLEQPTSGLIEWDGHDETIVSLQFDKIAQPKYSLTEQIQMRDVAYISKRSYLKLNKTVFYNIAYGVSLRFDNKSIVLNRVMAVAKKLGLSDVLCSKTRDMDEYTRHKIVLARAMARYPSMILLDDPYSQCDELTRSKLLQHVKKIKMTPHHFQFCVYATDSILDAILLDTNTAILHHGQIQQVDYIADIIDRPNNIHTAQVVHKLPLNLIEVQLSKDDNDINYPDKYWSIKFDEYKIYLPNIIARLISKQLNLDKKYLLSTSPDYLDLSENNIDKNSIQSTHSIACSVVDIFPYGGAFLYYASITGQSKCVSILSSQRCYNIGDTLSLDIDLEKIQLYDADTFESILAVPKYNILRTDISSSINLVVPTERFYTDLDVRDEKFKDFETIDNAVVDFVVNNKYSSILYCTYDDGIDRYDERLAVCRDFEHKHNAGDYITLFFDRNYMDMYADNEKITYKRPINEDMTIAIDGVEHKVNWREFKIVQKSKSNKYNNNILKCTVVDVDVLGETFVLFFKYKNDTILNAQLGIENLSEIRDVVYLDIIKSQI